MEYPLFNSKALSDGNVYDLTDSVGRLKYFHAKLGDKIPQLKEFLDKNSFVGFMLAKKLAGKGTYAKMVEDVLGSERFAHISVGDVTRNTGAVLDDSIKSRELIAYLENNYRGTLSLSDALDAFKNRSQDKISVPTDFILCLLKKEIASMNKKALFIDGLPRNMDQISASLYFRDLINYRDDPDFFVLIEAPLEILDTRMLYRTICPDCHTSRNILFTPTTFVKYDETTNQYYLVCDNKECSGYGKSRFITKVGDDQGIKSIEARLKDDQQLMDVASQLQGIPKILLRSSYPVDVANQYLEDYEIQPKLVYSHDAHGVHISKENWVITDDYGVKSYTIYAAVYIVNLLTQIHKIIFE